MQITQRQDGRFVVTLHKCANGKRTRRTKTMPLGFTEDQARKSAESLFGDPVTDLDSALNNLQHQTQDFGYADYRVEGTSS